MLFYKEQYYKKTPFLILIIFVLSYLVLSFNIENQGIDIDEVFHHGFGMAWFDIIKDGDSPACLRPRIARSSSLCYSSHSPP